jgi:hypothetical protein
MPKKMERALKQRAKERFPGNREQQDRYVYGRMRATGWKPKRERRAHG